MPKLKILLKRRKPVGVFLAEQEDDVRMSFPEFIIYQEEFEFTPNVALSDNIIKVTKERLKYSLRVDSRQNISSNPGIEVPFILLGDGDLLVTVTNAMANREEVTSNLPGNEEIDLELMGEMGDYVGDYFNEEDD